MSIGSASFFLHDMKREVYDDQHLKNIIAAFQIVRLG